MKKKPKVNEVNEFLEIARDFQDPLEVLRESLSNSYDANATEVVIKIRTAEHGSDIIIDDNGEGMTRRDLESFFDLGNSRKSGSIGYKGHGTKIFYKSDQIVVNTSRDNTTLRAVMDDPWEKLNNEQLPEYEVSETERRRINPGTLIRITSFKSGQGFEPKSLTYNKIHHYLTWKTIGGSTAHYFRDDAHEMEITVSLDKSIDDTRKSVVMSNKMDLPAEQLESTDGRFPTERMCRHFGPSTLKINLPDGSATDLQIVGMVGGKAARNELPTYGRHSAQFGIWLAKDHIGVERYNEAISSDNEFLHFFFIANCQDLELSANREQIRNKSGVVYQAITDELDHYMSKVAEHPWVREYLEERKHAELERRAVSQGDSVDTRQARIEERTAFTPSNPAEVIAVLERSNHQTLEPIHIADFNPSADINAIVESSAGLSPASISVSMSQTFADKTLPLLNTDAIVCWDYGDPDYLRQLEREGYLGGDIEFNLDANYIVYHNGSRHEIDIVRVADRTE